MNHSHNPPYNDYNAVCKIKLPNWFILTLSINVANDNKHYIFRIYCAVDRIRLNNPLVAGSVPQQRQLKHYTLIQSHTQFFVIQS